MSRSANDLVDSEDGGRSTEESTELLRELEELNRAVASLSSAALEGARESREASQESNALLDLNRDLEQPVSTLQTSRA